MTRIDFYILPQDSREARLRFAARLCEKALRQNLRTLILALPEDCEKLSELLWTFRADAFVPHAQYGSHSPQDKIIVSPNDQVSDFDDFAINLGQGVPQIFSRFQRWAEIVNQEPEILDSTRTHYALYKQRGYPINTHKIA